MADTKSLMAQTWNNFSEYLAALAVRYEQTYRTIEARQASAQTAEPV